MRAEFKLSQLLVFRRCLTAGARNSHSSTSPTTHLTPSSGTNDSTTQRPQPCTVQSPLFPIPKEDSPQKCYQASSKALAIYHSLRRASETEPSWMLVQGCFIAGITMLYAIWSCEGIARSVRLEEVTERCRMCSTVLAALSAQ